MIALGKLTRRAAALSIGRGASVAILFALNIILVRFLDPLEFGRFHEIRIILTFAALLDLGIPVALLQSAAAVEGEQRTRLHRNAMALAIVCGVCAGGISGALGFLPHWNGAAIGLLFAGVLIGANVIASVLESVLIVEEHHGAVATISTGAAILGFAGAWAVLPFLPSVPAVYAALAAAAVLRTATLWKCSGINRVISDFIGFRDGIELIRTSLAVSGHRALGMASGAVDRAVVAAFFSAGTLGWYVTGAWEVPFVSVFFGAIASTILPEMSAHWAADRKQDVLAVWQTAVIFSAGLVFPLWLWSWVWAPELLRVLFTRQYEAGLDVFRIYLLGLPIRVAVYSALLVAIEKPRVLVWGAVIDVALNLGLSVALAASIGPLGPAWATVLATYAQVVFYLFSLRGELPVPALAVLPWKGLFWALAAAGVAVLPTLIVRNYIGSDVLRLVTAGVVTGSFVLLGVYVTERKRPSFFAKWGSARNP
jgi:O-antigen/teichoic acid export membrane protein